MQYRQAGQTGEQLSLMGFGCMRFPRKAAMLDQRAIDDLLEKALGRGVNYFDTAYTYPGSEAALGRFIAQGHREHMLIATKMPHYQCKSLQDFDRIFEEQLNRLQTDHIDFYLMHMLTGPESWQRIQDMGVKDWIARRKASGQIRHIGFSFHGGREDFSAVLDSFDWEFCQIQLNYLDRHSQAGLEGLEYAAARSVPVIVMEPLRGGKLASGLPKAAEQAFRDAGTTYTPAQWALRWLFDRSEVTCVLSGMNSAEQLQANCDAADDATPGCLSEKDKEVISAAEKSIKAAERVGCTGCGYCMPCPHGVDIPTCFRCFNMKTIDGFMTAQKEYVMTTSLKAEPSNAGRCVGCGACVKRCPQSIAIPDAMKQVKRELEGVAYKTVMAGRGLKFKVE